ncbi:MAG TPA: universal stress protein [Rhizomicrobium sp.]|nr:universal stress protein [Rhizomicrobium sp.]
MFKNVLVPSLTSVCSVPAMELALKMAQPFEGLVEFLHVHPDARELARYAAQLDVESSMFSSRIWEAMEDGDKLCAARSRKIFDTFCTELGTASASFRELSGNNRDCTIARARYNDLVVMGRPAAPEDLTTDGTADVLVDSGRPLLLAPLKSCNQPLTTVVVAWKPSAPAARAVAAAMPLLARAEKIHVLGIGESGDNDALAAAEHLAAYLRQHGLKPQAGHISAGDEDAAEVLLEAAHDKLKAGVLVMGGYGHSRAREFVFGGFTRHVLHQAPLPVLMTH